jgi:hypothetical protein
MIEKDINKIEESDLVSLKENSISEGRTIEYKQSLPTDIDKDKIKFLAGISSFANGIGGDYIIGIVENKGVPTDVTGIEVDDIDKEKLRLEQIIRTGISPSIPSVLIRDILLANKKVIFLIRIPQSWISPHRVIYCGHDKFYLRNSAGKYPMDVDELRIAFTLSETIEKKIKNFKVERIAGVLSGDTPVKLRDNPKVILHFVPLSSFNRVQCIDLDKVNSDPVKHLSPIYGRAHDWRFNFDGYLTYSSFDKDFRSYVQLFRNGIIEAVEAGLIRSGDNTFRIPMTTFEKEIIESVERYLSTLMLLEVNPPVFIFLTLLDVKGYTIPHKFQFDDDVSHKIDKDILSLPEVSVNNFDIDISKIMRPGFDAIWNACGFRRSMNYDENGKRKE